MARGAHAKAEPKRSPTVDLLAAHLEGSILEELPDALVVVDATRTIVVSNRLAREAGVPRADTPVDDWSAAGHADTEDGIGTLAPASLPLADALAGRAVHEREIAIQREGARTVLSVSARPLHDAGGAVVGAMLVMHDVTARADLGDRVLFQSAIATHLGSGLGVVRVEDGRIVHASDTWERMLGYDHGELVGAHISAVTAPPAGQAPDARAREIARAVEHGGVWKSEMRNVRKDGTRFWCAATVAPFDHAEHGATWIVVQTDISEQKTVEHALRTAEERFRRVFEHAPVGIAVVANDLRLIDANLVLSEITGYPRDELLGRTLADVTHPDDVALDAELANKAFSGEVERYRINKRFLTKEGDLVPVAITATYVRDLADRPLHTIAIVEPLMQRPALTAGD